MLPLQLLQCFISPVTVRRRRGGLEGGFIRQPGLHLVAHPRQRGSAVSLGLPGLGLLGGNLGSLAGDGVLHGLQLLQQLLAAGQRVARVGARAGATCGEGGSGDARLAARWGRHCHPAGAFSRRRLRRRRQGTFPAGRREKQEQPELHFLKVRPQQGR